MERRILTILSPIIIGIAVIGFLRGTSTSDYDFGSRDWSPPTEDGRSAKTYAGLRDATTGHIEDVAKSCADCHPEQLDPASKGSRTQHPIGLSPPAGSDLTALRAAGGQLLATEAHPDGETTCRTCHRPHDASADARLVVTADEGALCLSCHTAQSPAHSAHPVNVTVSSAARSQLVALGGPDTDQLSCLSCHDPHGSTAGTLLRTAGTGSAACQACHTDEAGAVDHGGKSCVSCHGAHQAPRKAAQTCGGCHTTEEHAGGHPAARASGEAIGCLDCHDPHGSTAALPAAGSVAKTCTACHAEQSALVGGPHDGAAHPVAGMSQTCTTCHDVHSQGGHPTAPANTNPASAACLSCHVAGGPASDPGPSSHSTTLLTTAAGLPFPGPSPYFSRAGTRTTGKGEITCQTCHSPHTDAKDLLGSRDALLPYCGVCHGEEALDRYDRFHDDAWRKE
jgi:predicted CXXCH cytochrome family protein